MPVKAQKSVKTWIVSFSVEAELKSAIKYLILIGEYLSYADFVREALRDYQRHPYPIVPLFRIGHGSRCGEPLRNILASVARKQKELVDEFDVQLWQNRQNSHSLATVASYVRTIVHNFYEREYGHREILPAAAVPVVTKTLAPTAIPAEVLAHIKTMKVWKHD